MTLSLQSENIESEGFPLPVGHDFGDRYHFDAMTLIWESQASDGTLVLGLYLKQQPRIGQVAGAVHPYQSGTLLGNTVVDVVGEGMQLDKQESIKFPVIPRLTFRPFSSKMMLPSANSMRSRGISLEYWSRIMTLSR